ncbi:phosphotransferase [Nocardioides humi]|uniref:Aminoglycoside phosphotransferase domain-containing protein n=1 Tax=Nocardioides humi TaxID=449461 RepID=A0ABN2B401_9ACTN|nr:phosphotransferase [Nocardioides humi]
MHDRSALGPADVPDALLAAMVARLLQVDDVELVASSAVPVDYDLPAITTGGRWWVSGTAAVDGHARDFRIFVKHVHEWSRSPFFADLPEEIRPWAAQQVPWRTEGAVYRSDLGDRLPAGLAMPRAVGVHDIDDLAYSVWLEVVPAVEVAWDRERYARAAHLLGRLAGSASVRELAGVGGHEWDIGRYVEGRLRFQVLPLLGADEVWRHPLVAPAFGELRGRLLGAADRIDALAAELLALPVLVGQGDACPNNLLVRPDRDGFTLIDFGFFTALPVGFDLGQLLVGELQLGRGTADDLAGRDAACLASYVDGLGAEGVDLDPATVARAHALQLLVFTGLSSLPFEHLDAEPTNALRAMAATRAAIARYSLDLLDQTG